MNSSECDQCDVASSGECSTASAAQLTADTNADEHPDLARDQTLAALEELLALTDGLLAPAARSNLDAARVRVLEDRFNLVVVGEFKRGKSTLINALLGRTILPTAVVPLTAVVTVLARAQHERIVVCFTDAHEEEHPLDALGEYVTETGNPVNRRGVDLVRVTLDSDLLAGGLQLVDTPGVASLYRHNTDTAHGFLPRIDAALCVLDGGQPLSEAERDLLLAVGSHVPRLLLVVNKIDQLSESDLELAIGFVRAGVEDLLADKQIELFAVSARHGTAVAELRSRLVRLASEEGESLLLNSAGALVAAVAADAAQAARFEARAIELPLEELHRRATLFEQRIAELHVARAEADDLLERGVRRALKNLVDEPLLSYAREEGPRLRSALGEYIVRLDRQSTRELSSTLDQWIDTTVKSELASLLPRVERAIAGELALLESRYSDRVRQILQSVQNAAKDLFGARALATLPQTGLTEPSSFTFKLSDPENALEILVGASRTITPGRLGRRLVRRDAEQRLIAMTDRHAGRLRSELATRVREAAGEYRDGLAGTVGEAVDVIRLAVERAVSERQRGEHDARQRLEQLRQTAERCSTLAKEPGVSGFRTG
jgi:small GTP-binding protein